MSFQNTHMSALLRFFARFALVFEFLFLEIIAFVLIFHANAFQQSVIYRQIQRLWSQYMKLRVLGQTIFI